MILMRDMNLTYAVFEKQYKKQSERKFSIICSKESKNILRSAVVTTPTFPESLYSLVVNNRYKTVRGLCLFWERFPENIRYELYFLLLEKIKKFEVKKQLELNLLIEPDLRLIYLFQTKRYTSHEIFGNLLQEGIQAIGSILLRKRSQKVIKPQRKRGYDDKGTLRCFAIWNEKWKPSFDWTFTEHQNRLERKQIRQEKHLLNIKKLLRELIIRKVDPS